MFFKQQIRSTDISERLGFATAKLMDILFIIEASSSPTKYAIFDEKGYKVFVRYHKALVFANNKKLEKL